MKKLKKFAALFMSVTMLLVLVSCGGSGESVKNTIKYSDSQIKEYYSRFTTDSATFMGEIHVRVSQDGETYSGIEYYTTNGTNYYSEAQNTVTEDGMSVTSITKSWGIGNKCYYNVSVEMGDLVYEDNILIDSASRMAYYKVDEPDELEIKNGEVKVLGEIALPEGLGDAGTYYSEQIELNDGEIITFYFSNGELKYLYTENGVVTGIDETDKSFVSKTGEALIKIESHTAVCDDSKLTIPSNYTIMSYEEYLEYMEAET